MDIVEKLKDAANNTWPLAEAVSNLREPDKDNSLGRECMLMLDAAEEITRLHAQVEELSKYPEDLYLEVYSAIAHGLSDCEDVKEVDVDTATENVIKIVSRLAQYPEEAVRAVFELGVNCGLDVSEGFDVPYEKNKNYIAAIFNEKRGVGK